MSTLTTQLCMRHLHVTFCFFFYWLYIDIVSPIDNHFRWHNQTLQTNLKPIVRIGLRFNFSHEIFTEIFEQTIKNSDETIWCHHPIKHDVIRKSNMMTSSPNQRWCHQKIKCDVIRQSNMKPADNQTWWHQIIKHDVIRERNMMSLDNQTYYGEKSIYYMMSSANQINYEGSTKHTSIQLPLYSDVTKFNLNVSA